MVVEHVRAPEGRGAGSEVLRSSAKIPAKHGSEAQWAAKYYTSTIVFNVSCTLLLQLPSSITFCGAACFATYRDELLWIYAYVRGLPNGLTLRARLVRPSLSCLSK